MQVNGFVYSGSEFAQQERSELEFADLANLPEDGAEYVPRSSIEWFHELGVMDALREQRRERQRDKPRRPPQSAPDREDHLARATDALAVLTDIETSAGHTLRAQVEDAKRFQAAFGIAADRSRAAKVRLAQRKGLLNLLRVEHHCDTVARPSPRAFDYLDIMLAISANIAALTGSRWSSTLRWFNRNLPGLMEHQGDARTKLAFDAHHAKSTAALASRVPIKVTDYFTGPTAFAIADRLGTTLAHLRYADANRHGLTAVDAETKQERDRRYQREKRRAAGMKPQSERRQTDIDAALAAQAKCDPRTIRRHREKGTLDAYLLANGVDVLKVSLN